MRLNYENLDKITIKSLLKFLIVTNCKALKVLIYLICIKYMIFNLLFRAILMAKMFLYRSKLHL